MLLTSHSIVAYLLALLTFLDWSNTLQFEFFIIASSPCQHNGPGVTPSVAGVISNQNYKSFSLHQIWIYGCTGQEVTRDDSPSHLLLLTRPYRETRRLCMASRKNRDHSHLLWQFIQQAISVWSNNSMQTWSNVCVHWIKQTPGLKWISRQHWLGIKVTIMDSGLLLVCIPRIKSNDPFCTIQYLFRGTSSSILSHLFHSLPLARHLSPWFPDPICNLAERIHMPEQTPVQICKVFVSRNYIFTLSLSFRTPAGILCPIFAIALEQQRQYKSRRFRLLHRNIRSVQRLHERPF